MSQPSYEELIQTIAGALQQLPGAWARAAALAPVLGPPGPALPPAPVIPPAPIIPPAPVILPPPSVRFDRCLDFSLRWEGGYVNQPRDKGKATNRGITIATLTRWRRDHPNWGLGEVTDETVKALGMDETRAIYEANYWLANRCDQMAAGVDLAVFDWTITSGGAIRAIQKRLGANADGVVGPVTLALMDRFQPAELVSRVCDLRLAYYRNLEDWDVFGEGWTNRVNACRPVALAMVAQG